MMFSTFCLLLTAAAVRCSDAFLRPLPYRKVALRTSHVGMLFDPSNFVNDASLLLADALDTAGAVGVAGVSSASVEATGATPAADFIPGTSGEVSYSRASYYTILALYVLSFPGLWSTIKRSTTAKVKRMTFVR